MPEHQQIQQSKKPDTIFKKQMPSPKQIPLSNPMAIIQRAKINPKSLTHADVMQLQRTIGNRAVGRLLSSIGSSATAQKATVQRQEIPEEEEPLQGRMIDSIQRQEIPEEEKSLQGKFKSDQEQAMFYSCSTPPIQREEKTQGQSVQYLNILGGKLHVKPNISDSRFSVIQRNGSDSEEEVDPSLFADFDRDAHNEFMRNPYYRDWVQFITQDGRPVNVSTSETDVYSPKASWNPQKRQILIQKRFGRTPDRASKMAFEITNAYQQERVDKLDNRAMRGEFEGKEEKGDTLYAHEAERIEYDGLQLHHQMMAYGIANLGWPPALDTYSEKLCPGGRWDTFEKYLEIQEHLEHTNFHRSNYNLMREKVTPDIEMTDQQEPVQRQEIPEEEEPLQGKMIETVQRQEILEEEEPLQGKTTGTIQRQEIPEEKKPLQTKRENNTGLPDNLKAGVENLSGIDMNDVRVYYNSSKPAEVAALAYTQGTDIHVAQGQERHLPHEAWHVVQQAQGRVRPTMQWKDGVQINDDEGLEYEADVMGERTLQCFVKLEPEKHSPHEDWHVVQQMEGGLKSTTQTIQAQFVGVLNLSNTHIRNLFLTRYQSSKTDMELETRIQELRVAQGNPIGTIDELRLQMGKGFVDGKIPGQDTKSSTTPNVNAFPPVAAHGLTLYRTDGRLESTIRSEGFFPIRMMGMGEIRELINSPEIDGFASAWITNPGPLAGLAVAFAHDEHCGGQRGVSDSDECVRKAPVNMRVQFRPIYRVNFPQMFIHRQMDRKDIIANNQILQNATIIGIRSSLEHTIFTGVPGPLVNLHTEAEGSKVGDPKTIKIPMGSFQR